MSKDARLVLARGECPLCGRSPKHMSHHARHFHKMTNAEWREAAGLPSLAEQRREIVRRNWASLGDIERRHKQRGMREYSTTHRDEISARARERALRRTPEEIAGYVERLNRFTRERVTTMWARMDPAAKSLRTLPARSASASHNGRPTAFHRFSAEQRTAIARMGQAAATQKKRRSRAYREASEAAFKIEQRAWSEGRDMTPEEKSEWRHHLRILETLQADVSDSNAHA